MKMAESPSKWEENTVGKGEIARDEQFLLFPLCFQNTCTADTKNQGLFGKRLTKRQKKLDQSNLKVIADDKLRYVLNNETCF